MQKLGIIVKNLRDGQIPQVLLEQEQNSDVQIINFILEIKTPVIDPKFSINHLSEVWGFHNPIVTTCLETTLRSLQIPSPTDRFFYVWDCEWVNISPKTYDGIREIYSNPKVKVVARTETDKQFLEQLWGANVVGIIDNFDLAQFNELAHGQRERKRDL